MINLSVIEATSSSYKIGTIHQHASETARNQLQNGFHTADWHLAHALTIDSPYFTATMTDFVTQKQQITERANIGNWGLSDNVG